MKDSFPSLIFLWFLFLLRISVCFPLYHLTLLYKPRDLCVIIFQAIQDPQKPLPVTTRSGSLDQDLPVETFLRRRCRFCFMKRMSHEADDLLRSKMNGAGASFNKSNIERLLQILEFIILAIVQAVAFTKRNKWTI